MKQDKEPIEDSLLVSCQEFLHIASISDSMDGTRMIARFQAIYNLWLVRWEQEDDPCFPSIKDFVSEEQWEQSMVIERDQAVQFVGALSHYLIRRRNLGGG